MYLALFLAAMLFLYVEKEEKQPFFKYGVLSTLVVLFPVTRWVLNQYFQEFYAEEAWLWMLPIFGTLAFSVMKLWDRQWGKWQKRMLLPAVCLLFFLCGGLSRAYLPAELPENEEEIEQVYEKILNGSDERQVLLAAPREVMEGARAYDAGILTVYGRDIWEAELDYAFYDHYEEWAYQLVQHIEEPMEMQETQLLEELTVSGATHVVLKKENLTFGEDMQYPETLRSNSITLKRMDETKHYVIYVCGE